MRKERIKEVILAQHSEQHKKEKRQSDLIERELFQKIKKDKSNLVVIISGMRRVGKSTLVYLLRKEKKEKDYFLDFDDEKLLNFSVKDFEKMEEVFLELYGEQDTFYFDEIQNIRGWERFVRRLHNEDKKVYITGSNASMLSRELGTHLTGRYLPFILFPFSFREFLNFKKVEPVHHNFTFLKTEKVKIKKAFEEYFKIGGFPEFLKLQDNYYLDMVYESVLYRDIITRYDLSREKPLKELVLFIASNLGKSVSYNSLLKTIGVKNPTTVKQYFDYLENSYLTFLLTKFDYSLKKQMMNHKKMYFIDQALSNRIGFRFSQDRGRFLENVVFLELRRMGKEIFYFQEGGECDFVLRRGKKIIEAIQVTDEMSNEKTRQREIDGLLEAMSKFKLQKGLILTSDEEDEIRINGRIIEILPIWKWLLKVK
jgi:predicted AAA+ superfamily ATPase